MQEKFYRRAKFWRLVVALVLLLVFIIAFWGELTTFSNMITEIKVKNHLLNHALVKLAYNIVGILLLFYLWTLVVSQFVLPVQTSQERRLVFDRILRYFSKLHGPAVFIDRGVAIADDKEMPNTRPGVAFVDLCSAITLEKQWEHVETGKDLLSRIRKSLPYRIVDRAVKTFTNKLYTLLRRWLKVPVIPEPLVRIASSGLVFTDMNEKIRGIADLRPQSRNADVRITTRDGFEIQVPVSVIFTIGEKPETLYVTYDWDVSKGRWQDATRYSDLRVVKINKERRIVEKILDDLDETDQSEIHQYVRTHLPAGDDHDEEFTDHDNPPYHFDADRVFAALYSKALEASDSTPMNWTELPIHVAVEHLRNLIAEEDYDTLYQFNDPAQFPLYERVMPEFKSFMRNQGVLSYQFIIWKNGNPIKEGETWLKRDIDFFQPQELKNSKVLRNRGIRVLGSGFSEFTPKHPGVREQLVDHWRARWENEANEIASKAEMEAINIVAQAKRIAYREIIGNLELAYTGESVPKDALALRLFQVLEQAIMDPKTQALLPKDGISMLVELRNYLTPSKNSPPRGALGRGRFR